MRLGVILLVNDKLNKPHYWERWAGGVSSDKLEIIVHAKSPNYDGPFADKVLPFREHTQWGGVMNAELTCWGHALLRGCDKTILVSESCIPLHSFDRCHEYLFRSPKSYLFYRDVWWSDPRALPLQLAKHDHMKGHMAWICLNREHMQFLISHPDARRFAHLHICDEYLPGTLLKEAGRLETECERWDYLFVDWSRPCDSPEGFSAHPHTFIEYNEKDFVSLNWVAERFYFARKFAPHTDERLLSFIKY